MKQNDAPNARPCRHILHTDPPLYVFVTYCPQHCQPDFVRASCERDIDSQHVGAIDINLTDHDLQGYQRLRDAAGLFAHVESHAPFLSLPHSARAQAVGRAIACMEGTVDLSHKTNQCAIYDPEAGAWHFAPIGMFFDAQNEEACPS